MQFFTAAVLIISLQLMFPRRSPCHSTCHHIIISYKTSNRQDCSPERLFSRTPGSVHTVPSGARLRAVLPPLGISRQRRRHAALDLSLETLWAPALWQVHLCAAQSAYACVSELADGHVVFIYYLFFSLCVTLNLFSRPCLGHGLCQGSSVTKEKGFFCYCCCCCFFQVQYAQLYLYISTQYTVRYRNLNLLRPELLFGCAVLILQGICY